MLEQDVDSEFLKALMSGGGEVFGEGSDRSLE
jgi:hypothetical protein